MSELDRKRRLESAQRHWRDEYDVDEAPIKKHGGWFLDLLDKIFGKPLLRDRLNSDDFNPNDHPRTRK